MKVIIHLFFYVLLSSSALASEEVSFAYEEDWPPYITKNLFKGGIVPRLIETTLSPTKVTKTWGPWARIYRMAKHNEVNCVAAAYMKEERKKYFHYSVPYLTLKTIVASRKEIIISVPHMESLKKIRTGIIRSYGYPKKVLEAKDVYFIEVATNYELMKLFNDDKIDAFIMDENVIGYLLNTSFPNLKRKIRIFNVPIYEYNIHAICSKKFIRAEKTIDKFNKNFRKLKESGEIDRLINRYKNQQEGSFFPSFIKSKQGI